jgi:hypothetical protein
VTNTNFDVLTPEQWRACPGAFSPRPAVPGTGVLGVARGTGPSIAVRSVPRARDKAVLAVPAPLAGPMAQLGQTNNYNHMTSVLVVGEGTSGPPPYREPA